MISQQKNFIFVHIPKTAGNALQNILMKYSEDRIVCESPLQDGIERFNVKSACGTWKHSTLAEYLTAIGPEEFRRKFRFTCVRNPWDRAISFYFSPHRQCSTWDREHFLRFLSHIPPMTTHLMLRPDDVPENNFDFIMRYENLTADFHEVCDQLGIPREPIPVRNKSVREGYRNYFDQELVEIVGAYFKRDIELFGYSF